MILYASNTKHIKLNFKNVMAILLLLTVIVAVAYKKIELYFIEGIATEVNGNEGEQDFLARFVLYATSFDILKDYFPFGSGLASFATHASGEYYSGIYEEYEIDTVWGLSKTYHKFIADTYYPSLAEMQDSLTLQNSSSSLFTLKVMSVVSLLIPFVLAYICYAWRALDLRKITIEEMEQGGHRY